MCNFRLPKKKKSHVKKMRAARRRYRGSQRRGTLYNLFDSKITYQINNIKFYRGRSLKPQRPLPLTRMMVSQSQEIPLTSSQLCPVLLLLLQKDPVVALGSSGVVAGVPYPINHPWRTGLLYQTYLLKNPKSTWMFCYWKRVLLAPRIGFGLTNTLLPKGLLATNPTELFRI
ncbi:hypothetical protein CRENBAI_013402 [Crenichthys baileyi]|uniref:Uncharacterized protein n=1 Tax=Crenichthys baileyi TaxID=28760 RepID=A0AAV9QLI8_9TELE